jgi:carbon-monoxide dehydrogenase medium subunit
MGAIRVVSHQIHPFAHSAPRSVDEVIPLLQQDPEGTRLMAGGTDLIGAMRTGGERPARVVSLKGIPELKDIGANGSELGIGALSTIQSLLQSPLIAERCPALRDSTIDFATPQIRRMATVGGNICWSSPSADTVPPLLAFDAELELVGAQGVRSLALEDFFTGAGSNRLDREVLTRIRVPLPEGRVGSAYQKLARTSSDIAQIGCAVRICVTGDRCEEVRIALGAVADRPIRARGAEGILRGQQLNGETLEAAARKVREEISPITDVRASASWRSHVSAVLTRRMLELAIQRAA